MRSSYKQSLDVIYISYNEQIINEVTTDDLKELEEYLHFI